MSLSILTVNHNRNTQGHTIYPLVGLLTDTVKYSGWLTFSAPPSPTLFLEIVDFQRGISVIRFRWFLLMANEALVTYATSMLARLCATVQPLTTIFFTLWPFQLPIFSVQINFRIYVVSGHSGSQCLQFALSHWALKGDKPAVSSYQRPL